MKDHMPRGHHSHTRDPDHGAPRFLWILVGVMAAIEAVLSLSDAGIIGTTSWRWPALAIGAFWQPIMWGDMAPLYPGQRFSMFVTHAFLHGGLTHLALNSVVLLALGKLVAQRLGPARTLALLGLSAIGGGLAFGLLASSSTPMIGASGAVFGLIGIWQAWEYRMRRDRGLPLQPVVMAIAALAVANVLLFAVLGGGLAWQAHLGGWLVGFLGARYL